VSRLEPGRIIKAWVKDHGGHEKKRPAVVMTPAADIASGRPVFAFAISTKFARPLPPSQVFLPADPSGAQGTFLEKDCVAVCDWHVVVDQGDILKVGGKVPANQLRIIAHFFRHLGASGGL
jgi:mRNA-degrading endonuclease toxin of MazEF toxin-antitoxin module